MNQASGNCTYQANDVVVWEWYDDFYRWKPYEDLISNSIQNSFLRFNTGCGPQTLIPAQFNGIYTIDFLTMCQTRNGTGTARKIRQTLYKASSAVAKKVIWKFETDRPGLFQDYDFELGEILEEQFKQDKKSKHDLRMSPCRLPYIIDFQTMTQTRIETGRIRPIKRHKSGSAYMKFKEAEHDFKTVTKGVSSLDPNHNVNAISITNHPPSMPNSSQASNPQASSSGVVTVSAGPVTRSAAQKAFNKSSIAATADWHPPLSLPGMSNKQVSGTKPKATTKKMKPKKSGSKKMLLPAMGSVSNTGIQQNVAFHFGGVKKKIKPDGTSFEVVVQNYTKLVKHVPKDEDCCICMCELSEDSSHNEGCNQVIKLKCNHMFHKACLSAMYASGTQDGSIQCPKCKAIHGVKNGNCPYGTMDYSKSSQSLPGHTDCGLIQIVYNIPRGIQGKEHPNPGQSYHTQGFPRVAYLPDNAEGQKILQLLIKAWERRLTFTVATSVTTGLQNAVVWNEIHHKTEITNQSGHGYPDPNYFTNVSKELASQGVVETDEEEVEDGDSDTTHTDTDDDL